MMRSITYKTVCALLVGMYVYGGLSIAYSQGGDDRDPNVSQEEFDKRAREFGESQAREREAQERRREQRLSEQKDAASPATEDIYILDEQLQQAWTYFSDYENRRREVAVDQFQAYLREHPDTIFLPEIYFRIGQLYCSHRNEKYGEEYDPDMMVKYYQLALDSYGPGYADFKYTAWASIVNRPDKTLDDRSGFYDWLCSWEDANDPNSIYPVKPIAVLAQGRSASPCWSEDDRVTILKNVQKHLPQSILAAEQNIFHRSTPAERLNIIERYPNTEMGRQARRLFGRYVNSLIDDEVHALTEARPGVSLAASVAPDGGASDGYAASSAGDGAASDQEATDATGRSSSVSDVQATSKVSTTTVWTVGCVGVVSPVLLLVLLQRRWRSVGKKTR